MPVETDSAPTLRDPSHADPSHEEVPDGEAPDVGTPGADTPGADTSGADTSGAEPTGWLDLARVVAIGAVVLVHDSGAALGSRGQGDPATPAWWAAAVLDSASRWCVPVFLMVSGSLLLDPARGDSPRAFYRRRLARIGWPLVVWTGVYLVFGHLYLDRPLGVGDVVRAVGSGSPFLQLYYLYVIAGLYLLAPYLRAALAATGTRAAAGLAGALLVLAAVDQVLMTFVRIGEPNAATRFLPYLGYFVAGRVLRDLPLRTSRARSLTRAAAVALPVSVAVTVAGAGWAASGGRGWGRYGEYALGYFAPNVMVMSLALFWLLRVAGTRGTPGPSPQRFAGRWVRRAADLSFGIFLVHALLWYPLVRDWEVPAAVGPYLVLATWHWLVVVGGSAAVTAVLRRLPLARRLV